MNVYSHVDLDEKARAVASMPGLQNHRSDAQQQRPEGDEDDGGRGVKISEPVVGPLPGGALSGALHLTWNGLELARVGIEGSAGGFRA